MENKLIAFFGDKKIKDKYIKRVKAHARADEIVKGQYWENGKGCAVGCTIHSQEHDKYPKELGISWRLALIEDSIFEKLPNDQAKKFPLEFLEAVQIGSDTDLVYKKFVIWILGDKKDGLVNVIKYHEKKVDLLNRILKLYKKSLTKEIKESEWKRLADEAYSASASASASAYASASASAYASASASAYASASASAYAYASAYASAYAYASAEDRYSNKWQEIFDKRIIQMKDKLLELLREAK